MPATRDTRNHANRTFEPEDIVSDAKRLCMAAGKASPNREVHIIRCLLAMLGRLERRDDPEYKNITWDKD